MPKHIAFMPLTTYSNVVSDAAIQDALRFGAGLGLAMHVAAFAADLPQPYTPMGDMAFDISSWIEGAKQASAAEAKRLHQVVTASAVDAEFVFYADLGAMMQAAPAKARVYDAAVLPWQKDAGLLRELAEAVIFGAGRPAVLVPLGAKPAVLHHLAIAWDGSAVAARALNDGLMLLAKGGKVTILAAEKDSHLSAASRAEILRAALTVRGYHAASHILENNSAPLAETLQSRAKAQGADLLAMGGFGHSRLRDFILGGTTKGVFAQLTMPVLLSH